MAAPPLGVTPSAGLDVAAAPNARRRSAHVRHAPRLLAALGVACVAAGIALWAGAGEVRSVDVGSLPAPAAPVPAARGVVPVAVTLPARGTSAPVVAVGTRPDGGLVIPEPPTSVGWWAPGALAGSGTGSVVLAGHVDSREAGLGMFAVLPHLAVGEPVRLRGADGRDVDYRVVARREYPKAALPPEVFARDGAPRLVLITCGGRFDAASRSYDDNVVVYAEPAPGTV